MWPKKEESGRQQEKREERKIDTQKHTHTWKKQHWAIGVKLKLTIAITIKITIAITIPIPINDSV